MEPPRKYIPLEELPDSDKDEWKKWNSKVIKAIKKNDPIALDSLLMMNKGFLPERGIFYKLISVLSKNQYFIQMLGADASHELNSIIEQLNISISEEMFLKIMANGGLTALFCHEEDYKDNEKLKVFEKKFSKIFNQIKDFLRKDEYIDLIIQEKLNSEKDIYFHRELNGFFELIKLSPKEKQQSTLDKVLLSLTKNGRYFKELKNAPTLQFKKLKEFFDNAKSLGLVLNSDFLKSAGVIFNENLNSYIFRVQKRCFFEIIKDEINTKNTNLLKEMGVRWESGASVNFINLNLKDALENINSQLGKSLFNSPIQDYYFYILSTDKLLLACKETFLFKENLQAIGIATEKEVNKFYSLFIEFWNAENISSAENFLENLLNSSTNNSTLNNENKAITTQAIEMLNKIKKEKLVIELKLNDKSEEKNRKKIKI